MKIIIDTDPGQDDAITALLAIASPEIELLGVTTVAGNVPVSMTTRNALQMLDLAGRPDIPVYAGSNKPLLRAPITATHVHGASGFEGAVLPPPSRKENEGHAVDFIIDTLRNNEPGTITICTIGPLTNIALALNKAPEVIQRAKQIVMMAGAFSEVGNITPAAEFNIYVDPHAAQMVLSSGIPIVMMPLDITHQLHTSAKRIARMEALPNRVGPVVAAWLRMEKAYEAKKYGTDGGPLHDPNTVMWLLRPDIYSGRKVNVQIETQSELTMGMSVVDWWQVGLLPANVTFLRTVDDDEFYEVLIERLGRLP
ncbi:hypothetical protein POMI540_2614 [Schizosaccharomyces pombe]|uniref:Uncharacterized protein C1683.06c n=1 Tax=Schizosaccharomyces pombe (strain 972 / ATCC 24843) TaxID=284812 RepID=YHD6_SCHPO|nr:putative uridine ribohydrolase [Schizosaccharomyces pombe]Q9P6J4.1 RecName: Full=Uncharacterized protein C1683.06c [Schizosaccharomyces pombe 972h-]CAB91168.1 uridine ribohydrolase (predicted) [Schizosaccharomyces pombe]|eukprot:NP_595062.1 putative uridine ribohydrolase [Schizosaccharomyces pombe]